jgi:hypothetical protein
MTEAELKEKMLTELCAAIADLTPEEVELVRDHIRELKAADAEPGRDPDRPALYTGGR